MAITQSLNSKGNIKKLTNQDMPYAPAQPVISRYSATSVAGQTVINLTFSVDTTSTDIFFLYVNGQKLVISSDYSFTSIASDLTSSQITLNFPLTAFMGIEAYKMGLKKESEFQTDNRFVTAYDYLDQAFQSFVAQNQLRTATSVTGTPAAGVFYSTISNRASMVDFSQDLKPRMGIERVMVQQLVQLQNEFGPNGEAVWGTPNDTFGQIRFVGNWSSLVTIYGQYVTSGTNTTDYTEITFYGTGLNILAIDDNAGRSLIASIDGGAEGVSIFRGTSAVLEGRSYNINTVVPVVSGLTLGIHTAKIRNGIAQPNLIYGFEILNESTLIKVTPGVSYYKGQKYVSSALQSFSYSAPVTGTRGGRVLTYQTSTGAIGQSFQAVNGTATYLGSVSHINEEVSRVHAIREFGAGRSDDFSLITPASAIAAAFTLDDGTTTLVTSSAAAFVIAGQEGFSVSGSQFITLTFVGTGLDVDCYTAGADTFTVTVDGTAQGSMQTAITGKVVTETLASGLPYGTHTVKIARGTASSGKIFFRYRVYQPKKPSLPAGAVELADYNVMANYVANTSTADSGSISFGVLRKNVTREFVYTGNVPLNLSAASYPGGFSIDPAVGATVSLTFFGSGVDLKIFCGPSASNAVGLTLNGLALTTANFPNLVVTPFGAITYSAGTLNTANAGPGINAGVSITGLPLGINKLTLTNNATNANPMELYAIDIITPIHSAKSNTAADLQNTLPVGSQAISDNRKTTAIKEILPSQKAWAQAVGVTSSPGTTSTVPVPVPDMATTVLIKNSNARLKITFSASVFNNNTNATYYQIMVDGVLVGAQATWQCPSAAYTSNVSTQVQVPIAPGAHFVQVVWYTSSNVGSVAGTQRILTVEEL